MFLPVKYLRRQSVPLTINLLALLPHELPEVLVTRGGDVDGVVLYLPRPQDLQDRLLPHLDLENSKKGLLGHLWGVCHLFIATVSGEKYPHTHLCDNVTM